MGTDLVQGYRPLRRCIDLANAVRADPRAPASELERILVAHGEPWPRLTKDSARRLRAAIGRLLPLLTTEDVDEGALGINAILAECGARPRLSRHDDTPWHLHVAGSDEVPWDVWLLASSALAMAMALSERGRRAWGTCAATGCIRLFADTGRGSPRRYCSQRCATRMRVTAHRLRSGG